MQFACFQAKQAHDDGYAVALLLSFEENDDSFLVEVIQD